MSTMASQLTDNSTVDLVVCLGSPIWNTKIHITGALWGEVICDRWIPLTKGQFRGRKEI